jgi:hypothetical protein
MLYLSHHSTVDDFDIFYCEEITNHYKETFQYNDSISHFGAKINSSNFLSWLPSPSMNYNVKPQPPLSGL